MLMLEEKSIFTTACDFEKSELANASSRDRVHVSTAHHEETRELEVPAMSLVFCGTHVH